MLPCVGSKKRQFLGTRLVWKPTILAIDHTAKWVGARKLGHKNATGVAKFIYRGCEVSWGTSQPTAGATSKIKR